jgi:hypothetical protein
MAMHVKLVTLSFNGFGEKGTFTHRATRRICKEEYIYKLFAAIEREVTSVKKAIDDHAAQWLFSLHTPQVRRIRNTRKKEPRESPNFS